MTHNLNLNPARARLAAAALGCMATVAAAQVQTPLPPAQAIFTMVSPALPEANEFWCTVTNVSSQPVTLNLLQIVEDSVIRTNVNPTCTGTLPAGERCTVRTGVNPVRGQVVPHCRARFTASQEGAVVGSLRSSYIHMGTYNDLAVVPLQPLRNVPLALAFVDSN